MKRKLYIINNSLKDYGGHFFETGLAVAEAARDLGLIPIMGVHFSCPVELTPAWLETVPLFQTDHWMAPAKSEDEPPVAGDVQDMAAGQGRHADNLAKSILREMTPPFLRKAARWLLRRGASESSHADPPGLAYGPLTREQLLQGLLTQAGCAAEYGHMRQFQKDLTRLLTDTDCREEDHVLLHTAHGRELLAIHRLAEELGPRCPTFHLEFRHDMEVQPPASDPGPEYVYRALHRIYFHFSNFHANGGKIHLAADTVELAQDLQFFADREFGVLPIPFRTRLMKPRRHDRQNLCLGFFGDAREEKGFHWLPRAVEALWSDYVQPGRVTFLIQGTMATRPGEVACPRALSELRRYPADHVRLIGVDGPLSDEEYYRQFAEVDILLCPYDAYAYRFRSSGVMAEALATGIPTVVPARTWLARQQPPGGGLAFEDLPSFLAGVGQVCDSYDDYQARAADFSPTWLSIHSPANLVKALLAAATNDGAGERQAA